MASPSIPSTYRAYRYTEAGDALEKLSLDSDVPQVAPLPSSHVRIKVHSAALNPADYKIVTIAQRFFAVHPIPPPYPIGFDLAGTVVEVGADVTDYKVGDAVYGMANPDNYGSFAEYIALDQQFLAKKPEQLTFNEAAGIPLVSLTSYQALVHYGKVTAGSRVLILGGSSGTGIVAVQIAHALGAYVIATTSARNADFVKSLGADETIDYTSQKWVDVLSAHSLDAIYDCGMEPESWNDGAQRVLKTENAHFVTIGGVASPIESPIGATYHQIMTKPSGEDLKEISKFVARGELSAHIDSVFAFGDLFEAIRKLKTNRARGKVVLEIVPEQQKE
ncbi:Reticulon-4-interacting protein 1, partial [Globisporangium splendens]